MSLRSPFVAVLCAALPFAAGCSDLLTPEKVREHIENPTAEVAAETMGRTARDFFAAKRASAAQSLAFFAKSDSDIAAGVATQALAAARGSVDRAVQLAGADSVGDVFCVAGLTAGLLAFDACGTGDNCEAELTVDSCVLRIGDGADENARGKIVFKLKNEATADLQRTDLRLTFEDFEITDGDTTQYFDGLLALETTTHLDRDEGASDRTEVVLASDITQQERRIERFPLFDDGVITSTRAAAGLRFTGEVSDTEAGVTVELLAFVDDADDRRDESVVLSFAADAKELPDDQAIAGATLAVRGSNGDFECTWSAATEELAEGGGRGTVRSAGSCVDEDGETFEWEAESTSR